MMLDKRKMFIAMDQKMTDFYTSKIHDYHIKFMFYISNRITSPSGIVYSRNDVNNKSPVYSILTSNT